MSKIGSRFRQGTTSSVPFGPGARLVLTKPFASQLPPQPSAQGLSPSAGVPPPHERLHVNPGPGKYDGYRSQFDTAGKTPTLSPYFEARRSRMRLWSSSDPSFALSAGATIREDARGSPPSFKKQPFAAPSPVRYAPLSRADICNIAGPPALLLDRTSAHGRSALSQPSAAGIGSLPATRLYGLHRACVREVGPGPPLRGADWLGTMPALAF